MSTVTLCQRPFSGESDLQAMMALARATAMANLHVADLPYRLSSWALDDPDSVGLWVDGAGQLQAWAVMQAPFWTIDYVCEPKGGRALQRRVLAWAGDRARRLLDTPLGHPCWFVNVFADQAARIRDLEEAGFACQADVGEYSWSKVLLRLAMDAPLAARLLPAGLAIRHLAGESESVMPVLRLHALRHARAVSHSTQPTASHQGLATRAAGSSAEALMTAASCAGMGV